MSEYTQVGRESFKAAQQKYNEYARACVDSLVLNTTRSLMAPLIVDIIPATDLKYNLKQYAIMRKRLTKGERNGINKRLQRLV